jgi:hypothetical protein
MITAAKSLLIEILQRNILCLKANAAPFKYRHAALEGYHGTRGRHIKNPPREADF